MPQYPIEVEQNVLEWTNDEPLTEVDYHGISNKTKKIKKRRDDTMKYTRENILEGINKKLEEQYGSGSHIDNAFLRLYKQRLPEYPIEVEQNVLEWINDKPITEVDCHGISIRYVMDCFNLSDDWFPLILRNFVTFKNDNFRNRSTCFINLYKYE